MKSSRIGLLPLVWALALVIAAAACGSKTPAAPTPTPEVPTPVALRLETPAPRSPIAAQQLDVIKPTLSVTNAVTAGAVGAVTYEFEVSELDSFPAGSRTSSAKDVAQGGDGTTSWSPPSNLLPNFKYFWRARATAANVAAPTEWSQTETFRTRTQGFIIAGQEVYDPLTDGSTVGNRIGGRMVAGQGWQATSDTDGLFYDFGSCTSCTMEFDVTNFGKAVGASEMKDYKWVTMGDASTFGNFSIFRNHIWKMHLEQRSDGNGTGMKLIWRNGGVGDGNPGDHEHRNDSTVDWRSSVVYRFTLQWTPTDYSIRVGTVNADGTLSGDREWFAGSFGGRAYAPPSLRISLGCYPRGETMTGAIWRNVRIFRR
ncbi:MAG TPA: hypothetical protein VJM31_15590 [Vicinamibacterales bacterium]|nr:hypothetical protein [Vicinamibacterales bacterium]